MHQLGDRALIHACWCLSGSKKYMMHFTLPLHGMHQLLGVTCMQREVCFCRRNQNIAVIMCCTCRMCLAFVSESVPSYTYIPCMSVISLHTTIHIILFFGSKSFALCCVIHPSSTTARPLTQDFEAVGYCKKAMNHAEETSYYITLALTNISYQCHCRALPTTLS